MNSARRRKRVRTGGGRGIVVALGWLALLLASLSFVTWRQPIGVEMERSLRELESERASAEAERVAAGRRIEELRSRSRITAVARDRLGMHIAADDEIVFLPSPERYPPGFEVASR